MNTFANLLPSVGGNRPPLSDEELRRLAEMLQQRGEGLAAINPKEAQMLKDAGGSGVPLPGTKGLGVGGGPIRSYIEGPGQDAQIEQASSSNSSSSSTSSDGGYGQYAGGDPPEKPDQGDFETRPEVIVNRPSEISGDGGSQQQQQQQQQTTPKFYDSLGGEHDTQEAADAASLKITQQQNSFETYLIQNLTSDSDFETFKEQFYKTRPENFEEWRARNNIGVYNLSSEQFAKNAYKEGLEGKGDYPVQTISESVIEADLLPESEVERIFNIAMKTVQAETTLQTEQFRGNVIDLFNDGTFTARGKRVKNQQGEIIDVVPTTFAEADAKLTELYPDSFGRLSESQKRAVLQDALEEFARIEAFTLTIEDVERFTRPAPEMDTVDDITATDIATVGDATAPTVDAVDDVTQTTLDDVLDVASDAGELKDVLADEDELIEVLKSRVEGTEPSVAEIQLKRGTEQNLKALLATTAGVMDPTKLRQTRNMWMDIQQIFTGQKAELRAAEQVQAEQNLLAVLKAKGTREASIQIANMEKDIRMSIEQGNLDQARKIKNQQAALTLVTVQAEIDKDVRLANLDKERIIAIEQGKMDLATKIANLEKEILIAKVNAQLALDSRKMDDALAIAAYQGEQALAGVEVEIDLAEMKSDLTTAGFELQKDLALMDRETKLAVARLVGELKAEEASADRNQDTVDGLIGAIATVGAAYLKFSSGLP